MSEEKLMTRAERDELVRQIRLNRYVVEDLCKQFAAVVRRLKAAHEEQSHET